LVAKVSQNNAVDAVQPGIPLRDYRLRRKHGNDTARRRHRCHQRGGQAVVDGSVYAFNDEGEAVVKRLSRDAGQWWLTSDNSDQRKYHRKLCNKGDCLVIGKVVRKESDQIW
jgi:hypothetical protein